MYYIGADLGGTNIAVGICDEHGNLLGKVSRPTAAAPGPEGIAGAIAELGRLAAQKAGIAFEDVEAMGIGVPGATDIETGMVEYATNIGFHDVPLAKMVGELTGKRVHLENDANAAALGEYVAGTGRGTKNFIAITLGTGVGGGVIAGGRLLPGNNSAVAELGHIVINRGGAPCNCGRRGCWEAYSSATALIRMTKEKMQQCPESRMWQIAGSLDGVNGRTVFEAFEQGDAPASELRDEYISWLACGITNIVNIFQPEVLCIGGGIANEGEKLIAPVRETVARENYGRDCGRTVKIVKAVLGNDAGIIGAAMLPVFAK